MKGAGRILAVGRHGTVIENPFNHRRLRVGRSTSLVESSTTTRS